ncbi:hypothetical protein CAP35_08870 [Chitinophagaceae bacterium IBVUCB1]|nr:hypothetical protein CAP35_08870 [Chitinophagaceae bacterium IBVUCB1]
MAKDVKNQPVTGQKQLLLLSFFEGACVMVAELAGGKMQAPFYGTSLYVWASTLAITLGGLTLGYYWGGELSKKEVPERQKTLFLTLAISSAFVALMPVTAKFIMAATLDIGFLTGLITSQVFYLLPPIIGMGMVSPMLISLIATDNKSGKAAGLIYAVSTLGGVIATMITGFWLVPTIGVSLPCIIIGAVLLILSIIILRPKNKLIPTLLLLLMMLSFFFYNSNRQNETEKYKILYHTEGMLGQVKVVDFTYTENGMNIPSRVMLVNHNWQTWINSQDKNFSFLYYTRFTNAIIKSMPAGSHALLIGLGGGTVAHQMEQHGISYDAVEIDGRLPMLAEKYFGLHQAVKNTVVDDGRHYINTCKKKYDLIIVDALLGENIPSHLLSKEAFTKMKSLLNPSGKIFIEFDGIKKDEDGLAQQMVYNTLNEAGFRTRIFSSSPNRTNYDIMYIATQRADNSYDTTQILTDAYYPIKGSLKVFEVTELLTNPSTAIVTDETPSLDYYLRNRMVAFREEYLGDYNAEFLEDNMSFFR